MAEKTILTPIKAIRAKCLDCCGGSANEVKLCTVKSCSLYPYRFGKNPNRKGTLRTEEQKAEARERMRKMHDARKIILKDSK